MTKQDIVNKVSLDTKVDKALCKKVIDAAINMVAKELSNGRPVYIRGLFTLSAKLRKQKKAQDIRKKKTIIIPEHYVPHAKFSDSIINKLEKKQTKLS